MDEFKKYINEHREEGLDSDNPPDIPWHRIYSKVSTAPAGRTRVIIMRRIAAASVTVLLAMGVYFFATHRMQPDRSVGQQPTKAVTPNRTVDSVSRLAGVPGAAPAPATARVTPRVPGFSTPNRLNQASQPALAHAKWTSHRQPKPSTDAPMDRILTSYRVEIAARETMIRQLPVFSENLSYLGELQATYKNLTTEEQAVSYKIAAHKNEAALYQVLLTVYEDKISLLARLKTVLLKLNSFTAQGREASDTLTFKYVTL